MQLQYKPRKREIFLALAGVLLGATACGWLQQCLWFATGEHRVALAQSSDQTRQPAKATPVAARLAAPKAMACAQASASARQPAANRLDHLAASAPSPLPVRSSYYQANFAPTPAAWPIDMPLVSARRVTLAPAKLASVKEAVELVGLVDGKAIFTLPRDVAEKHNLMSTFTLGKGQQYAGLTLESVGQDDVVLRDGRTICSKQLAPIN